MATIAHLSDLHFGRHDPDVVASLELWLAVARPDLVVISGDLTQRARGGQFREARAFLDRLGRDGLKVLAVPGNHDVPLYDVLRRFLAPLHRYRRYISEELCPRWEDDELVVLGINTARSLTFKDGSIAEEQLERIRRCFDAASTKLHVLVTHHPLLALPIGEEGAATRTAKRSALALRAAADAGVDLLLAGHFHRSHAVLGGWQEEAERAEDHATNVGPALVVQAGTATSTRLRGDEAQSFNWLELHPEGMSLTVQTWNGSAFQGGPPAHYDFRDKRWSLRAGG
jgi:3',5'-cyclic AMP phosphodiesterase CpdA